MLAVYFKVKCCHIIPLPYSVELAPCCEALLLCCIRYLGIADCFYFVNLQDALNAKVVNSTFMSCIVQLLTVTEQSNVDAVKLNTFGDNW